MVRGIIDKKGLNCNAVDRSTKTGIDTLQGVSHHFRGGAQIFQSIKVIFNGKMQDGRQKRPKSNIILLGLEIVLYSPIFFFACDV